MAELLEHLGSISGNGQYVYCLFESQNPMRCDRLWLAVPGSIVVFTLDNRCRGTCRYADSAIDYIPDNIGSGRSCNVSRVANAFRKYFGKKCDMYWLTSFVEEIA
jgi:hypothetical protein